VHQPDTPESRPAPIPRWVKVFAVVAGLVVLIFLLLLITGGHGPGRHSFDSSSGVAAVGGSG
jgi:hypothetical protein